MSQPLEVTLTPIEIAMAGYVGVLRTTASIQGGRTPAHGVRESDRFKVDIAGAVGELAFCKALGLYWAGSINTFKGADVGANLQVRTGFGANYSLIVRQDDRDRDIYVLVLGWRRKYRLAGWMVGSEAKDRQWLRAPAGRSPAYFVPQAALRPMGQLSVLDGHGQVQAIAA